MEFQKTNALIGMCADAAQMHNSFYTGSIDGFFVACHKVCYVFVYIKGFISSFASGLLILPNDPVSTIFIVCFLYCKGPLASWDRDSQNAFCYGRNAELLFMPWSEGRYPNPATPTINALIHR